MALLPVTKKQVFTQKKDTEGRILGAAQAAGGLLSAAGFVPVGGAIAGVAALRQATRQAPEQGSWSGDTGAPLVAMAQRAEAMRSDPYAQMVQARAAIDTLPIDYETKMQYAQPLDEAMYAYQKRYSRGSV